MNQMTWITGLNHKSQGKSSHYPYIVSSLSFDIVIKYLFLISCLYNNISFRTFNLFMALDLTCPLGLGISDLTPAFGLETWLFGLKT